MGRLERTATDRCLGSVLQAADVLRAVKVADARNLGGNRAASIELVGLLLGDALDALQEALEESAWTPPGEGE